MLDMVTGDFVFLPMQIHTDRTAATVGKVTLLDQAVFGAAYRDVRTDSHQGQQVAASFIDFVSQSIENGSPGPSMRR